MTLQLVTFSTPNFNVSKHRLLKSAHAHGIKNTFAYSQKDFKKTIFYKEHQAIAAQPRGAGYWLWKPYYILEHLKKMQENDILIYCDSGVDIISSLDPLINIVKTSTTGILLFENYQAASYFTKTQDIEASEYTSYVELNKNKYWAKRDAFVLMDLDEEKYWNSAQVDANFQIYRKCDTSVKFVEEWLSYCCNPQIITDVANECGLPDFKNLFAHIHDQAIISILAAKYELELYRCASQYGNHYKTEEYRLKGEFLLLPYRKYIKNNSDYGTLLLHHRTKYMPFIFRIKSFIKQEWEILKANML